jgi:hypothetical protein
VTIWTGATDWYLQLGGGIDDETLEKIEECGELCSTADGETYYTSSVTPPVTYNPSWEYCTYGTSPTLSETDGIYTWDCPAENNCTATNEYCGDDDINGPEYCDGTV